MMGFIKSGRVDRCEQALAVLRKESGVLTSDDRGAIGGLIAPPAGLDVGDESNRANYFVAWLEEKAETDNSARDVLNHIDVALRVLSTYLYSPTSTGVKDEERVIAIAYVEAWLDYSRNEPEPWSPAACWHRCPPIHIPSF